MKRPQSTLLCRVGRSLGLAAALVAATVLAPGAGAQSMAVAPHGAAEDRGDLALVPYYTVRDQWLTGIHIVNTSDSTQVVKVRFRRATDGMNALDFNVVMSPQDVYAGFLSDDQNGNIAWSSPDSSCTAPAAQARRLAMPPIYRVGAESGYVEIIAMGQAQNEQQPLAVAARHDPETAMPLDCAAVRSNFFADGRNTAGAEQRGVLSNHQTYQPGVASASNDTLKNGGTNTYTDSGNVLKVSYFIRDNSTGIEFGDNAVHIANFLGAASITNQQYGIASGDLNGFDFPDLDGTGLPSAGVASGPDRTIVRGLFEGLRRATVLGSKSITNEWSANPVNGVVMDWVVTLPGQYTMLRLPQYLASLGADRAWVSTIDSEGRPGFNPQCPRQAIAANPATAADAVAACDFRDLPLKLTYEAYNREESKGPPPPPATLAMGPQPPTARAETYLPKVANVISFGGRSVLGQPDVDVTANLRQPFGWVEAQLESQSGPKVCRWDPSQDSAPPPSAAAVNLTLDCATSATGNAPVIGFAAWSRRLAVNSEASYGRIVEHSYARSNIPLRVDAGADQFVLAGEQVLLNAEVSGANVRIESIQWRQMSDAEVTLSDADTAQASFTAPAPTGGVRFVDREFEVTARDDQGRVGRDTVRVRVALLLSNSREGTINVFVGPDESVDEESDVQLWGLAIATGKAVIASQTWTQTSGQPTVNLVNASQPLADFEAPKLPVDTAKRDLTFKFEVTRNQGAAVNKSVTITVRDINNRAPRMTSPVRADLQIGDWRVFELTAEDGDTTGEPIRFKLGGTNKALFTVDIDNDKSVLRFKTPPQGDTPVCSETACVITITPSDGLNKGTPQTVTITVAPPSPPSPPKRLLNDTGVNFSGYRSLFTETNRFGNATTCIDSAAGAPQDCDQGRDSMADLAKTGAGAAGFDFTKLGANGEVLAIQNAAYAADGQESRGTQWSCVRDNHTGLVWEVKTQDNGVHGRTRTFSMKDFTVSMEDFTVTQLLQAVNSGDGHCGFTDWRVPNLDELHNIVLRKLNIDSRDLAIDTDFFPNTVQGWYWSASRSNPAGIVNGRRVPSFGQSRLRMIQFRGTTDASDIPAGDTTTLAHQRNIGGRESVDDYTQSHFVRLVRGAPALSPASSSRYIINSNGTVTDQVTQLMWQRCRVGASGANCTTRESSLEFILGLGWTTALKRAAGSTFAGFTDWRVPNINELISLVDYEKSFVVGTRLATANPVAFPTLTEGSTATYMSSSPVSHSSSQNNSGMAKIWAFNFVTSSAIVLGRPNHDSDDPQGTSGRERVIFVRDATPTGTPPTPVAPGGLLATADDSQVKVSWTSVTGAAGYRLYYSQSPISATSPGGSPGVKKVQFSTSNAPTSSNPFTVYELTNDKRYYFRVTAIGVDNAETAPSSQDSALPSKYPGGPRTRTK